MKWMLGLLAVILLAGCGGEEAVEDRDDFPHYLVHEGFSYTPFTYPADWDVTAVSSNVRLAFRNEDNPEENQFAQVPFRYSFTFGERAPDNEVSEEELDDFNEENRRSEETFRQNYYHTSFEQYARLDISKNGFLRLLTEYEGVEEREIGGREVLVLRNENQWAVNWYAGRNYYDLLIYNEAMIASDDAFEGILEMLMP